MWSSTRVPRSFATPLHTRGVVAAWWRVFYRLVRLVGRPLSWLTLRRGFGNMVIVHVAGRTSGQDRVVPLGLLTVGDQRYLGHPSGDTGWTLNVRAAGVAVLESATVPTTPVRVVILERGPERDAAMRAAFRQQVFPGALLYRLAGRHVAATGIFFRLEAHEPWS